MRHGVQIGLKRAWLRVMSLDTARALRELQAIQRRYGDAQSPGLQQEIDALRAGISAALDERPALHAFARSTPQESASSDNGHAIVLRRLGHWQQGDFRSFHAARRPAIEADRQSPVVLAFDRALDAATEMQQLRLTLAAKLARESMSLASRMKRRTPVHRFGEVLLARILYEQGDLSQAEMLLRDHFHAMRSRACADVAIGFYTVLARIAIDQHKGDLAMFLLRDGIAAAERRGWQRMSAACWQEMIELLVITGKVEEAQQSVDHLVTRWSGMGDPVLTAALLHMQSRVQLASGDAAAAVSSLTQLHTAAEERGDEYACARLRVRLAEALDACGHASDARDALLQALEVGCRAGLHQCFVSAGPQVSRMLSEVSNSLIDDHAFLQPYINSLLSPSQPLDDTPRVQSTAKLRGPLSGREQAILMLMRHGSSNKLIARRLGIAPETVKSHAKRIYGKLGAQSRVEAVTKATSLSLI